MLAHIIEKIKQHKEASHLTTQQIAERSGVPASTISRILSGQTDSPSIHNIVAICRAVGVSLDELFGVIPPKVELELPKIEPEPPKQEPVVDHSAELAAMYKDQLAAKDAWIRRLFCACLGLAGALTALSFVAVLF
jgi:transcriptional regulator with XRE-family HTH domain